MVLHLYSCNGGLVESAITVKGQATIPKAIREHLGLKPGDRVKFFMHPDGSVVLLPKRPASVLRGIVKPRRRPAAIERMLEVDVLVVESEQEVFTAMIAVKEGRGSFADALIGALGARVGCSHTVTFDQKA